MAVDLFGFAEPAKKDEPHVFSVSELTRSVRDVLEEQIGAVWVEGEISNCRKQASGHQYFTLKDSGSQLACVLFARQGAWRKQAVLSDGMHVQVRGALTVYEARGQYQLNVQLVQAGGAGLLQARFEALKRKLEAEGLFAPERKRALPRFPMRVGIVTSPTGAALRDMLQVLARRAPWVQVVVHPVRVQGDGAAEEIAAGVAEFDRFSALGLPPVDVVVVARGGGSVEDLWAFNEEIVARAIAASKLPVLSAVGHEIDFTIADFVADARAPTPSAAAEVLAPDQDDLLRRIRQLNLQLTNHAVRAIEQQRERLSWLVRARLFQEPLARMREVTQRLDLAVEALHRSAAGGVQAAQQRLAQRASVLRQHRPDQLLALWRQRLDVLKKRLPERTGALLTQSRGALASLTEMLRLLGPAATLARGYSVTTTAEGLVINSAATLAPGTRVRTTLAEGAFESEVLPG